MKNAEVEIMNYHMNSRYNTIAAVVIFSTNRFIPRAIGDLSNRLTRSSICLIRIFKAAVLRSYPPDLLRSNHNRWFSCRYFFPID